MYVCTDRVAYSSSQTAGSVVPCLSHVKGEEMEDLKSHGLTPGKRKLLTMEAKRGTLLALPTCASVSYCIHDGLFARSPVALPYRY